MKNKINLFIALGIPLILVFGMIAFSAVRNNTVNVKYDAVFYSQKNSDSSSYQIMAINGKAKQTNYYIPYDSKTGGLVKESDNSEKELDCSSYKDRLTFYKTNKNKSVSIISCEEVAKLSFYATSEFGQSKSPDGYTVNFYPNFSSPLSYFFGRSTPYDNEQKTLYFNNETNQDISELTIPFETGYIQKNVIGWVK